jgi:hypothetical protein
MKNNKKYLAIFVVKNDSIMQRLKKSTKNGKILAQKKLKKKHQNRCIFRTRTQKTAYKIG